MGGDHIIGKKDAHLDYRYSHKIQNFGLRSGAIEIIEPCNSFRWS